MKNLELYIHIPFCVRKCEYCDFLSAPAEAALRERYLEALKREISGFPYREEYQVTTVFFGGGTPSLLTGEQMEGLMKTLRQNFHFASLENPSGHMPDGMKSGGLEERYVDEAAHGRCEERCVDGGACGGLEERRMDERACGRCEERCADGAVWARHEKWCADAAVCTKREERRVGGEVRSRHEERPLDAPEPEITVECNPGTADREKLEQYRRAGINRISFGLQSAKNQELKALGRVHTWEDFLRTYKAARDAGFTNINIDLMSALPGQTPDSWEETLGHVLALRPEHISAYSLIIEEGTPFYQKYREDEEHRDRGEAPRYLPSEEAERQMYRRTQELLAEQGYQRYEISNYARPGFQCRHNIGYWIGTEYAGFGLGASSLLRHTRCRNPENLEAYLEEYEKHPPLPAKALSPLPPALRAGSRTRETIPLSLRDQMEEFMFLGLRLTAGVSEADFLRRFGRPIQEIYGPPLEKLQQKALLKRENNRISLTPLGVDVSNQVLAEFLF